MERAVRFGELVGVVAVAVDVSQGGGGPRSEKRNIRACTPSWLLTWKIPKHVCRRRVGGRVRLVGTIEGGELDRISDEEDGLVVEHPVWLPSAVLSLIAHPRTSRMVSAEPRAGPTVDMRVRSSVRLPTPVRKSASVRSEMSWVTSK